MMKSTEKFQYVQEIRVNQIIQLGDLLARVDVAGENFMPLIGYTKLEKDKSGILKSTGLRGIIAGNSVKLVGPFDNRSILFYSGREKELTVLGMAGEEDFKNVAQNWESIQSRKQKILV